MRRAILGALALWGAGVTACAPLPREEPSYIICADDDEMCGDNVAIEIVGDTRPNKAE